MAAVALINADALALPRFQEDFAGAQSVPEANAAEAALAAGNPLGVIPVSSLKDAIYAVNEGGRFAHQAHVARIIADLAGSADIRDEHLFEAINYRPKSGKLNFNYRRCGSAGM